MVFSLMTRISAVAKDVSVTIAARNVLSYYDHPVEQFHWKSFIYILAKFINIDCAVGKRIPVIDRSEII